MARDPLAAGRNQLLDSVQEQNSPACSEEQDPPTWYPRFDQGSSYAIRCTRLQGILIVKCFVSLTYRLCRYLSLRSCLTKWRQSTPHRTIPSLSLCRPSSTNVLTSSITKQDALPSRQIRSGTYIAVFGSVSTTEQMMNSLPFSKPTPIERRHQTTIKCQCYLTCNPSATANKLQDVRDNILVAFMHLVPQATRHLPNWAWSMRTLRQMMTLRTVSRDCWYRIRLYCVWCLKWMLSRTMCIVRMFTRT